MLAICVRASVLVLALPSLACGPGDEPTVTTTGGSDTAATSGSEATSESGDGTSTTTSASTSGATESTGSTDATETAETTEATSDEPSPDLPPEVTCEPHIYFKCEVPVDCGANGCDDDPKSPFDANGCMRPACPGDVCPPGTVCKAWNTGFGDYSCSEIAGHCYCGGDPVPGDVTFKLCFPR
ncbi:MAG: hypothetical protein R3A51_10695 [Nannocystaceae bacterium]|nr:hypothetical protein [Myxococcales bacterium]